MTLALLYHKGPSAFCHQKFKTGLTLKYLYGLNSFNGYETFVGRDRSSINTDDAGRSGGMHSSYGK